MSTTTGADLITKADRLARELARCQRPVDSMLWESFDTTAYRLMRELIGPGRDDSGAFTRERGLLLRVIHAYPTPLRPPLDADFSVTAAMRFVSTSESDFKKRVRDGVVPTRVVNGRRRVRAADLDARPDITPADPADPHPLARLSSTLGVLADLVNEERRHPGTVDELSDQAVRDATARVMTWLAVAGRYTLRHGPIEDAARPLAVAQYAERSIDTMGGAAPSTVGLHGLAARVATADSGLTEQLDSSLHHWAAQGREELKRTIPSTQVMANIASIGTLMMATTHRLHTLSPTTSTDELVTITSDLRGAADALKEAENAWKHATTLQPQGRAFGAASFELFDTLRKVIAVPVEPETHKELGLDVDVALGSLQRGVRDLARFVEQSHDATRACVKSGLAFVPARDLVPSLGWIKANLRGYHVPCTDAPAARLLAAVQGAQERLDAIVEIASHRRVGQPCSDMVLRAAFRGQDALLRDIPPL